MTAKTTAFNVVGLGFGDEGKGTIVDYLTRTFNAGVVIRHSSGPQAGHNVQHQSGAIHTFSQFGAGTFANALTYLTDGMIIDLYALSREADAIAKLNNSDLKTTLSTVAIHPHCNIITPWNIFADKIEYIHAALVQYEFLQEQTSDSDFKATYAFDYVPSSCLVGTNSLNVLSRKYSTILSLKPENITLKKITALKEVHYYQIKEHVETTKLLLDKIDTPESNTCITFNIIKQEFINFQQEYESFLASYSASQITEDLKSILSLVNIPQTNKILDFEKAFVNKYQHIIFEGAQGILLDHYYGEYPYNTWTDSERGVKHFCSQHNIKPTTVGVTRSYLSRHGSGPFHEDNIFSVEKLTDLKEQNVTNFGQGSFRTTALSLIDFLYAISVVQPDVLAITHLDAAQKYPTPFLTSNHIRKTIHANPFDIVSPYILAGESNGFYDEDTHDIAFQLKSQPFYNTQDKARDSSVRAHKSYIFDKISTFMKSNDSYKEWEKLAFDGEIPHYRSLKSLEQYPTYTLMPLPINTHGIKYQFDIHKDVTDLIFDLAACFSFYVLNKKINTLITSYGPNASDKKTIKID